VGTFVFLSKRSRSSELLDDIAAPPVPLLMWWTISRYLAPYLMYQLAPLGALVAVLDHSGNHEQGNEIVAIKASGMRLVPPGVPLLLAEWRWAAIHGRASTTRTCRLPTSVRTRCEI